MVPGSRRRASFFLTLAPSLLLVGLHLLLLPSPSESKRGPPTRTDSEEIPPQCGAGKCTTGRNCECCNKVDRGSGDPVKVKCNDYFDDPSETCDEAIIFLARPDEEDVPEGYTRTIDQNCGWDPLQDVTANNEGKWVCPDCNTTNANLGLDLDSDLGYSIENCTEICDSVGVEKCIGFAHYLPNTLGGGSDCETYGAGSKHDLGSCYFLRPDVICKGFAKPGVDCYERILPYPMPKITKACKEGGVGTKGGKKNKGKKGGKKKPKGTRAPRAPKAPKAARKKPVRSGGTPGGPREAPVAPDETPVPDVPAGKDPVAPDETPVPDVPAG